MVHEFIMPKKKYYRNLFENKKGAFVQEIFLIIIRSGPPQGSEKYFDTWKVA